MRWLPAVPATCRRSSGRGSAATSTRGYGRAVGAPRRHPAAVPVALTVDDDRDDVWRRGRGGAAADARRLARLEQTPRRAWRRTQERRRTSASVGSRRAIRCLGVPGTLYITGDAEADGLLNHDGTALLIGMLLDQQVPMEWAFAGPATLRRRLGHLDASRIAAMDVDDFVAVCCEKPAIHRFPAALGRRIHALCEILVRTTAATATNLWIGVVQGGELYRRLRALPGYGDEKARIFVAILGKTQGVTPEAGGRPLDGSVTTCRGRSPTSPAPSHSPGCASGSGPRRRPGGTSRTGRRLRPLTATGSGPAPVGHPGGPSRAATRPAASRTPSTSRSSSCTSNQTRTPSTAPTSGKTMNTHSCVTASRRRTPPSRCCGPG